MLIDHIHFYVENATKTRDWLMEKMGFQSLSQIINSHTQTEIVTYSNSIFLLISSPINISSPVCYYLDKFASGVVDVGFKVKNIDCILQKLVSLENYIINSAQTYFLPEGKIKVAKVKGWNSLEHTLVENTTNIPFCSLLSKLKVNLNSKVINIEDYQPKQSQLSSNNSHNNNLHITGIDHVVLNVDKGELTKAVEFYGKIFGFKVGQKFNIKTDKSGLSSQALISPEKNFYFNINEPTSANSQIREFIDFNGGSGIQHIALKSTDIIDTVTQMRKRSLGFLQISNSYYAKLKKYGRQGVIPCLTISEWEKITEQQILIDFQQKSSESLLMQIFTKPIFNQPTFFFEIIERRKQIQGFGEGNFQALFELIEKQQNI